MSHNFTVDGGKSIKLKTAGKFCDQDIVVTARGDNEEWNAFWDRFQDNGNRGNYSFAFMNAGNSWDSTNFKPKHNIIMKGACNNAFYLWQHNEPTDIGAILKKQDVILDTSKAENMTNLFAYGTCIIGSLPTIDLTSATNQTGGIFNSVMVHTIEKLIVTTNTVYGSMFRNCYNLENIVVEGTIAQSGLDLSACTKLSADSLASFVYALSPDAKGLSVTFPSTAQATYDAKHGEGSWYNLIDYLRDWSIVW